MGSGATSPVVFDDFPLRAAASAAIAGLGAVVAGAELSFIFEATAVSAAGIEAFAAVDVFASAATGFAEAGID